MLRTKTNTVETLNSWSYINKSQAHKPPGAITCALACWVSSKTWVSQCKKGHNLGILYTCTQGSIHIIFGVAKPGLRALW